MQHGPAASSGSNPKAPRLCRGILTPLSTRHQRFACARLTDPSVMPVFEALPGASFIVNGATPAKNSALTSAGAELRLINGVSLLTKFDGEFAAHSQTCAGTGTVRYVW
jgi:uncharacterized protein with beta-barrel porin domain